MHKFRLLKIILQALFSRSAPDALAPRSFRVLVTPFDVELTRAASHSYFAWAGLGRWCMVLHNVSWLTVVRERWIPLTHSEMMQFKRAARLFSVVTVTTRAVWWDEKLLYFEHRMTQGETVNAVCYSRGALYRGKERIAPASTMPGLPAVPPFEKPAVVTWWSEGPVLVSS